MSDYKSQSCGALWKSDKREGMYTGSLEVDGKKIKVVAFVNDRKTKDTQPDISILIARPFTPKVDGVQPPNSW